MKLNEYQVAAMRTCMPSSDNFSYMMLNLVGEVGEFASKVAKAIRKQNVSIGDCSYDSKNHLVIGFGKYEDIAPTVTDDEEYCNACDEADKKFIEELKKEAGDILWQLSGLCTCMDWELEEIAKMNLEKLASRQTRGVIDGNGDNR